MQTLYQLDSGAAWAMLFAQKVKVRRQAGTVFQSLPGATHLRNPKSQMIDKLGSDTIENKGYLEELRKDPSRKR
jgi:hypothetical protein